MDNLRSSTAFSRGQTAFLWAAVQSDVLAGSPVYVGRLVFWIGHCGGSLEAFGADLDGGPDSDRDRWSDWAGFVRRVTA